jgi:hypothetical protein
MIDPQTNTLIKRLERSSRWWKRLALGAMFALVMVLLTGAVTIISQRQQIQAEHQQTEQALREAEAQKDQAQRALYFSHIALAERERASAP